MKYIHRYKKVVKNGDLKTLNNTLYNIGDRFKKLLSLIKKLDITEENKTTLKMKVDSHDKIIIDYSYYSYCLFEIVLNLDYDNNYRLATVIQSKTANDYILFDLIKTIFYNYIIDNSTHGYCNYIIPSNEIESLLTNLEDSFNATLKAEKFNL